MDVSAVRDLLDFSFNDRNWQYAGEGNCHIVISFPEQGLVMRFSKYSKKSGISEIEEYERYKRIFLFHFNIISPFLDYKYALIPVIAKISESQIKYLNANLENKRPFKRKNKIIKLGFVEIYPDHTLLPFCILPNLSELHKLHSDILKNHNFNSINYLCPDQYTHFADIILKILSHHRSILTTPFVQNTFSVEIKPKQGWVAISERRFPKCTFCMNQYVKSFTNKGVSNYCPLDLFSGDIHRIKYAILCLLETPQNNLKIFKNGNLIYGEGINSDYIEILNEWFTIVDDCSDDATQTNESKINFSKIPEKSRREQLIDYFTSLIAEALTKEDFIVGNRMCALNPVYVKNYNIPNNASYFKKFEETAKILSAKIIDTERVCDWTYKKMNKNCILNNILEMQKLDILGLDYAYDFYQSHDKSERIEHFINFDNYKQNGLDPSELNISELYVLSTIAKDCSIFVTTKQTSPIDNKINNVIHDLNNKTYFYNIALIDTGPKPVTCINKHWLRNINVINACLFHFNLL